MNTIQAGDHVGVAFATGSDFAANTVDFTRDGLAANARVAIYPGQGRTDDLRREFAHHADLGRAINDGRLDFGDTTVVHRALGRFDPQYLSDMYTTATAQTVAGGFSGLWVSIDMTWAAPDFVDPDTLIDFEAGAFPLFASHELTAICQYDLRRFSDEQANAACRAHPCTGELCLRREERDDGSDLRMSGETDMGNHAAWAAMIQDVDAGARLDITAMSFVDVAGVREVIRAAAKQPGLVLRVTEIQARMLSLLGLAEASDATLEIAACPTQHGAT